MNIPQARKEQSKKKDGKVIGKALKEAGCHKDGAKGVPMQYFGGYDKMVGVLEQLSSSVIDYWKKEDDAKLMACLDTPDKKVYAKEQWKLILPKLISSMADLSKVWVKL